MPIRIVGHLEENMRYTFEQVQKHAAARGVHVERSGKTRCRYEVSKVNDDSVVEECMTLVEVIDAIPGFAQNIVHVEGELVDLIKVNPVPVPGHLFN